MPTDRQLSAYRGVQQVAVTSCLTPAMAGWSFGADGKGKVSLNPPALVKLLTSSGVILQAGVGYHRWSGMLQKDAGAAFANRNNCVATLSVAMINALPTADIRTGKPFPKPTNPQTVYRAISQQTTTSRTDASHSNVSNVNGSGQQINNAGPATNYTGPVATGGGNAFQVIAGPPVTVDQKQQAHDALVDELRQLATYPERDPIDKGQTIAQKHAGHIYPRALYLRLSKYYDGTVASVDHGAELLAYERQYYAYEQEAKAFEHKAIVRVGTMLVSKEIYQWREYYEYCLNRASGFSADTIKGDLGNMNFGNYDEAEKTFQSLMSDPSFGPEITRIPQLTGQLDGAASYLLAQYLPATAS